MKDTTGCLCIALLVAIAFVCKTVVTVAVVVCSSTWYPAIFHPMSRSATVLARVGVSIARLALVACASSFLVLEFAFPLPCAFLETVDLHPVVIIRTCSISSRHGWGCSKVSGRKTPLQQSCSKSGTVCICTQLQSVPKKNRCHIHHHCVLTVSARTAPGAPYHSPTSTSQAPKPDSKPSVCKHHDLLHQSILTILCVWSVSAVSLDHSNECSNTSFSDQS